MSTVVPLLPLTVHCDLNLTSVVLLPKGVHTTDIGNVKQKHSIEEALALEQADATWKRTEIFNGPLKIRLDSSWQCASTTMLTIKSPQSSYKMGLQAMQLSSGIKQINEWPSKSNVERKSNKPWVYCMPHTISTDVGRSYEHLLKSARGSWISFRCSPSLLLFPSTR